MVVFEVIDRFFRQKGSASSSRIILTLFGGLILTGTLLLMLPFASAPGTTISPLSALFTATSAVCVTGLVVVDTPTAWTTFGQAVIIILIQLGGLGLLTSVFFMRFIADRGHSIARRNVLRDAISAPQIGGITSLMSFIIKITAICELAGMLVVLPVFLHDYGIIGIWYAIFHSISSFCNAGFDILGGHAPFSSLESYQAHPVVVLATSALIIIGGIGFLTWDDIRTHHLNIRRYRLQTKLVLSGTLFLLLLPTFYFCCIEYTHAPLTRRLLLSFFCAVTPRTAGFATTDYATMSESGRLLTGVLMLIGGSSGSTAGGIKVTSLMVVLAAAWAVLGRRRDTTAFRRRIEPEIVRKALAFFVIYIMLWFIGSVVLSSLEHMPALDAMFECASALGTVGLTAGVTPKLGAISQLLIIGFMYFGRIGGLTMAYAVARSDAALSGRQPSEQVSVG